MSDCQKKQQHSDRQFIHKEKTREYADRLQEKQNTKFSKTNTKFSMVYRIVTLFSNGGGAVVQMEFVTTFLFVADETDHHNDNEQNGGDGQKNEHQTKD